MEKLVEGYFPVLSQILLYRNALKDKAILYFQNIPSIVQFDFGNNLISHIGVTYLLNQNKNRLTKLNISSNNLGQTGSKLLVKLPGQCLTQLAASYCKLNSEGLKHLAKAYWPNIKYLQISDNFSNDDREIKLYETNWKKLIRLQLSQVGSYKTNSIFMLNFIYFPRKSLKANQIQANINFKTDIRRVLEQSTEPQDFICDP